MRAEHVGIQAGCFHEDSPRHQLSIYSLNLRNPFLVSQENECTNPGAFLRVDTTFILSFSHFPKTGLAAPLLSNSLGCKLFSTRQGLVPFLQRFVLATRSFTGDIDKFVNCRAKFLGKLAKKDLVPPPCSTSLLNLLERYGTQRLNQRGRDSRYIRMTSI